MKIRLFVTFMLSLLLVALLGSTRSPAATDSGAKISAHLTRTTFTAAQIGQVKVIYRFSDTSRHFNYLLTRKSGNRWLTVVNSRSSWIRNSNGGKTGTGHFSGTHSLTIERVFYGFPVTLGRYRLLLSVDTGSRLLTFVVRGAPALTGATQVVIGASHACALMQSGRVKCWGDNGWHQLGSGASVDFSLTPVTVKGITTATAISSGVYSNNTCALLASGRVSCWGDNDEGELGNGTTTSRLRPVHVSGIATATQVSVGWYHACALLADHTVSCWGRNGSGQLGNGTTHDSHVPVQVAGITTATQVSAGDWHTCALLQDHAISCWGDGSVGQLGDGTTTDSPTPAPVSNITTATNIAAGGDHTCAVLSDHTVSCWGWNSYGQLGDNKHDTWVCTSNCDDPPMEEGYWTTDADSSTPVQASGITTARKMAGGDEDSCALLSSGVVSCWGNGAGGALGNGTHVSSAMPIPVSGITTATDISAGANHACALLANTKVSCWGFNGSGELGNGTTTNSSTPVHVR